MAPLITIPATIPATSQHILIRPFIRHNTITCTIFGEQNSFLPFPAILAVATRANIEAVVRQDPGLQTIYFPDHSRSYFSNRIHKCARKMFVVAVSERLGMNFLRIFMREPHAFDRALPFDMALRIRDENNEPWPQEEVRRFLEMQSLVCAPRFTVGLYKQVAGCRSSLPIVEAKRVPGRKDEQREVYEVKFHDEHLSPSRSAKPGEHWVLGRRSVMRRFADLAEATKDASFEMGVFGFSCEGMYYLVGDP